MSQGPDRASALISPHSRSLHIRNHNTNIDPTRVSVHPRFQLNIRNAFPHLFTTSLVPRCAAPLPSPTRHATSFLLPEALLTQQPLRTFLAALHTTRITLSRSKLRIK
uniref:Uncharacterized protein n=1 Tax=Melanopsichium pennsylvanicum 4 TaxID=1398559 RepID=A0A077R697_9BASI|nr:uncharacterized protein BN887_06319 [Melanopsichium pennsylvanicum 4]